MAIAVSKVEKDAESPPRQVEELLPEAELNRRHQRSEKTVGGLGRQNGKLKRDLA